MAEGRRTMPPWEARLLHETRYTAPPDTRLPLGWQLSAGGIPVPLVPVEEDLAGEIQAAIADMQDPDLAEDPGNLVFWRQFFADRRLEELARHDGPPGSPSRHHNVAFRRRWWSVPGRTLAGVMEHIQAGKGLQDFQALLHQGYSGKPSSSLSSAPATLPLGLPSRPVARRR